MYSLLFKWFFRSPQCLKMRKGHANTWMNEYYLEDQLNNTLEVVARTQTKRKKKQTERITRASIPYDHCLFQIELSIWACIRPISNKVLPGGVCCWLIYLKWYFTWLFNQTEILMFIYKNGKKYYWRKKNSAKEDNTWLTNIKDRFHYTVSNGLRLPYINIII